MHRGRILLPSSNDDDASGMNRPSENAMRMPGREGHSSAINERRMKMRLKTLHGIGAAIVMSTLVAGVATAAQMKATGPQPGDCKRNYEAINGPSAPVAQAMWVQLVASKYGNKW